MVTSVLTDTSKNTGEDMNADEFKQIYPKYFVPQYTHFDRKMKLDDAFSYVTNSENIKSINFFRSFPTLKKLLSSVKIKDNIPKSVYCVMQHIWIA